MKYLAEIIPNYIDLELLKFMNIDKNLFSTNQKKIYIMGKWPLQVAFIDTFWQCKHLLPYLLICLDPDIHIVCIFIFSFNIN